MDDAIDIAKLAKGLPKIDDVLAGTVGQLAKPIETNSVKLFASAVCYVLKERLDKIQAEHPNDWANTLEYDDWNKAVNNYLEFLFNNTYPKNIVSSVRTLVAVFRLPLKISSIPNWKTFADLFQEKDITTIFNA